MSQVMIGHAGKRKVTIDVELLLRSRLLIQANSGGGKSWVLRRLAEQLFGKVQVILIDREGEFASLREKYGYLLIGEGGDAPAAVSSARLLAEKLLELKANAVCDLYEAFRKNPLDRKAWVRNFLDGLVDAPKNLWRDVVVIVDEAHQFAPEQTPKASKMEEREIISGCKEAMVSLATIGRKRGLCAVWATQRLAKLDKDATAELFNRLIGPTIEDVDVDRAVDLMSVSREDRHDFKRNLKELEPGEFFGFGRAISKDRTLIRIGPVATTHPSPGGSKQAAEPPPAPHEIKHLLPKLRDLPQQVVAKAKTEADLRSEVRLLKAQLLEAQRKGNAKPVKVLVPARPAPRPAPVVTVKKVGVPIVLPKDLNRIEIALGRAETLVKKFTEATAPTTSVARSLRESMGILVGLKERSDAQMREPARVAPAPKPLPVARIVNAKPPRPVKAPALVVEAEANGEAGLSNPQKRMLQALLTLESLGVSPAPRGWLAGWIKNSMTGGAFLNNLGGLRTAGCVQYEGDQVFLTEDGHQHAGEANVDADPEAVFRHVLSVLSRPEGKMLTFLKENPGWMPREALAAGTANEATGGAFLNKLGHLRTSGFAEYGKGDDKNMVRYAEWLSLAVQTT